MSSEIDIKFRDFITDSLTICLLMTLKFCLVVFQCLRLFSTDCVYEKHALGWVFVFLHLYFVVFSQQM